MLLWIHSLLSFISDYRGTQLATTLLSPPTSLKKKKKFFPFLFHPKSCLICPASALWTHRSPAVPQESCHPCWQTGPAARPLFTWQPALCILPTVASETWGALLSLGPLSLSSAVCQLLLFLLINILGSFFFPDRNWEKLVVRSIYLNCDKIYHLNYF